jgi:hypothetical protein
MMPIIDINDIDLIPNCKIYMQGSRKILHNLLIPKLIKPSIMKTTNLLTSEKNIDPIKEYKLSYFYFIDGI